MKTSLIALGLMAFANLAVAEPEKYVLDPSHSQIVFSYNHLGYSTTWGMFSGFEGEIMFDKDAPAGSSVSVSMPLTSMFTGWEHRDQTILSPHFFGATDDDLVTFVSTGIEVTGETTARITGDLSMGGHTKSVVLEARLNQSGQHPVEGREWAGFDATATILRSDFGVGQYAPFTSDEVQVMISIEAMKAD